MADPFFAEIRIFPFNFAPYQWAFCDGQLVPISQNTALFSLLGTTYGGDGQSTFGLPDLQGRAVMHPGAGPATSFYELGEISGEEAVTLLSYQAPAHGHTFNLATTVTNADNDPQPGAMLATSLRGNLLAGAGVTSPQSQLAPNALAVSGGDQPHNNMQPYLTLNFCICQQGIYPPRP